MKTLISSLKKNILNIIAVVAVTSAICSESQDFKEIFGERAVKAARLISQFAGGIGLFFAKQFNVTGGTLPVTFEAKTRIKK